MAKGDIELPKNPTPPPSPKKRISEPYEAPNINRRTTRPTSGEGFSPLDLATETRGPIASKPLVEKELGSEFSRRYLRSRALERRSQRQMTRPYQLRGGRR